MGSEVIALSVAAAFLAYAIVSARQSTLMVAVVSYATVVDWIIQRDLSLLMAALGVAIVLGVGGLSMVVHRALLSQDDTARHNRRKLRTNNRAYMTNIGS